MELREFSSVVEVVNGAVSDERGGENEGQECESSCEFFRLEKVGVESAGPYGDGYPAADDSDDDSESGDSSWGSVAFVLCHGLVTPFGFENSGLVGVHVGGYGGLFDK